MAVCALRAQTARYPVTSEPLCAKCVMHCLFLIQTGLTAYFVHEERWHLQINQCVSVLRGTTMFPVSALSVLLDRSPISQDRRDATRAQQATLLVVVELRTACPAPRALSLRHFTTPTAFRVKGAQLANIQALMDHTRAQVV